MTQIKIGLFYSWRTKKDRLQWKQFYETHLAYMTTVKTCIINALRAIKIN